jgi:hypothetical protein
MLHQLLLGDQIRVDEIGRNVAHIGKMRIVYNILVGKLEGNRPHRRSSYRWKDNNCILGK